MKHRQSPMRNRTDRSAATDTAGRIAFEDLFDIAEIQQIQDDFSNAMGVASVITRPDGTPITRPSNFCRLCKDIIRTTDLGLKNCLQSDACLGTYHPKGPIVQPCLSGGLWDGGASITVGGHHVANWLVGQVRNEAQTEANMLAYARAIGADEAEFLAAYRDVPEMSRERFEQICKALFTMANQLSNTAYQNLQQGRFIAERRRMEEDLRRSELKFRSLYNLTGDAIMLLDKNGFFDCNEATLKMFGCADREAFCSRHPGELSPPRQPCGTDSMTLANMRIAEAMVHGRNRFEWMHKRADTGASFPAEVQLSVFELEGRRALQAVVRDITAQKKVEQELKDSAVNLSATLNATADGILAVDQDGKVVFYNRRFTELWNMPETILRRKDDTALLEHVLSQVCDPAAFIKEVERLYASDESSFDTLCFRDGRVFERYSFPLQQTGLLRGGRVWSFRDITESKRAEAALAAEAIRRRVLFEQSPDGIVVLDEDFTVCDTNDRFAQMLGYTKEDVLKMKVWDWDAQWTREEIEAFARNAGDDGAHLETRHRRKDGTIFDVEISSNVTICDGRKLVYCVCRDITSRKQAESALAEETIRRRVLFEQSPDGIVVLDSNGKVYEANARFAEMLGYGTDEVLDLHMWDWDAQWTREELEEMARDISITGTHFETLHRRKDGTVFDVEISSNIAACGGQSLVFCVCRDISDRKRAAAALAQANENLKIIMENAPFGVAIIDKTRTIRWANRAVVQMAGVEHLQEIAGQPCGEYLCPAQQNACPILDKGQTVDNSERVLRRKDGRTIPILKTVTDITLDGEDVLLETFIDIADRKRAEEALLESERRFRMLFENTPAIAVQGYDRHRKIIFWNRASEALYGYSAEEAIGRQLEDLIIPDAMRDAVIADVEAWVNGGPSIPASELTLQRADGTAVDVFSSHMLLQNIRGEVEMYCMDIDLTARKQAEDQLQRALGEAETLNRYLEEQTANANHLAALAEAANAAKSQFLANMSHEIRTPMNGVIGMAGLLLDTELTDEQREYAQIVCSCGESLLGLINDILDYSKIEAGRLELETLDFDIRDVLEDFSGMMAMRAHEKGLEFICAADPTVPSWLRGDPGRLRQILTNLTGNAIKFTKEGEVQVRVEAVEQDDGDALLRFTVRDTGIGIPPDKMELLFRSFSQVDASTTRRYGGTGLGLAISKQLAEIMGGRVGVSSEEGKGSEFWFTARLGLQPGSGRSRKKPEQICGKHILVVDDNATNRDILYARLVSWGAEVTSAPDGPSALECLAKAFASGRAYDAAIIDMQMPDMDGLMLGAAIRGDARFDGTCLLMMTSLGEQIGAAELVASGFSACLSKPIRLSEFFVRLTAALSGTEGASETGIDLSLSAGRTGDFGTVRILLAEDNITNQQVALGILRKMGLRADAVANGAEAITALGDIPYDLVLMDVQMPEMDGLEATRRIRDPKTQVQNHAIPIIAMTAHAMAGDREKCLESGMNDYVSKPVSPKELAEKLCQWLGQNAAGREADESTPGGGDQPEIVFDADGFLERLMGDVETAAIVIESFLEDIPRQIESLRTSLAAGDAETVERAAHSIKGAAANVGGEALREVASQIEEACKDGNTDYAHKHWSRLEEQFSRLKEAIERSRDR